FSIGALPVPSITRAPMKALAAGRSVRADMRMQHTSSRQVRQLRRFMLISLNEGCWHWAEMENSLYQNRRGCAKAGLVSSSMQVHRPQAYLTVAMHSISTRAPRTRPLVPKALRAGRRSFLKNVV